MAAREGWMHNMAKGVHATRGDRYIRSVGADIFSSNDEDCYFVKKREYICCHIITIYIQGSRSVIIQREMVCFFYKIKGAGRS